MIYLLYLLSLHDALPIFPGLQWTWATALQYVVAVCVCNSVFYSLSLVLSTCLDEVFRVWTGMIIVFGGGFYSQRDRKSTRLNSSHVEISYAVFCLNKKNP